MRAAGRLMEMEMALPGCTDPPGECLGPVYGYAFTGHMHLAEIIHGVLVACFGCLKVESIGCLIITCLPGCETAPLDQSGFKIPAISESMSLVALRTISAAEGARFPSALRAASALRREAAYFSLDSP
jgi:hypothetical protein